MIVLRADAEFRLVCAVEGAVFVEAAFFIYAVGIFAAEKKLFRHKKTLAFDVFPH